MTAIILAAPWPADRAAVAGIPVSAVGGQPVFCLADTTVRRWIRSREDEGCQVLIGDPDWTPSADVARRTLTFPADERDLTTISQARIAWETTHVRAASGAWTGLPRLAWEPMSPGWMAIGDQHVYLISRGREEDRVRLTRWVIQGGDTTQVTGQADVFAREVLDNAVQLTGPGWAKVVAQAYEDGRSIHNMPAWQRPGSTKPPFYGRTAPHLEVPTS